jgi:hypothetical protein
MNELVHKQTMLAPIIIKVHVLSAPLECVYMGVKIVDRAEDPCRSEDIIITLYHGLDGFSSIEGNYSKCMNVRIS